MIPPRLLAQDTRNRSIMKEFAIIGIAMALAVAATFGQIGIGTEVERFSALLVKQFETLPDNEAFNLWQNSQDPVSASEEMLDSALENERLDLLKRIFEQRYGFSALLDAVNRMPVSESRDTIVTMMLRWDSPAFWQDEDRQKQIIDPLAADWSAGRGVSTPNAIDPFVGTIGEYLPTLSIKESLFSTKEKRLKLANELEAAMHHSPSPSSARPDKRSMGRNLPLVPASNANIGSKGSATNRSVPPESGVSHPIQFLWAASLVVLGSLSWWLYRNASAK